MFSTCAVVNILKRSCLKRFDYLDKAGLKPEMVLKGKGEKELTINNSLFYPSSPNLVCLY